MRETIDRTQDFTRLCWDVVQLLADSHSVVAMRTLGLSGAWSVPKEEHETMIAEKAPVFTEAFLSGTFTALSGHGPDRVMQAAIAPISQKASANRQRLARCGPRFCRFGYAPTN